MSCIFGIYSPDKKNNLLILQKMQYRLRHRGSEQYSIYQGNGCGLGLHENQAIAKIKCALDGNFYEKPYWINYLKTKGISSKSAIDILTGLYRIDGEEFVKKLRGEFSFVIWDEVQRKLVLGRDQAGIKPLFYLKIGNEIIFCSEIKALLAHPQYKREVDAEGLNYFLSFGYVPWPKTLFKDIYQIPPGHCMIIKDGTMEIESYWQFTYRHLNEKREEYYIDRHTELINEAVKARLEDGIKPAAFLSGGLDSSSMVALLSKNSSQKVLTFTAAFDEERFNEGPIARRVANYFKTEHHEVLITSKQAQDFIPEMIWSTDQPFFDSTAIATFLVSRLTSGYSPIVFDAHGPDQLLGGFGRYTEAMEEKGKRSPLPEPVRKFLMNFNKEPFLHMEPKTKWDILMYKSKLASLPFEVRKILEWTIFKEVEKRKILNGAYNPDLVLRYLSAFFKSVENSDLAHKLLYWDTRHMVHDDLMVKVERMTTLAGIDTRIPFLDAKLMDFIAEVPSDLKLKFNNGEPVFKYILRKSLEKDLPDFVMQKKKQGFSIPLVYWLKNDMERLVREILLDHKTLSRSYFDKSCVFNMVNDFYKEAGNVKYTKIWGLLIFELWHRTFIDGDGASING